MTDLQTQSLWSHLAGQCKEGHYRTKQLEILPSLLTDWRTWKEIHPNTSVLLMNRTFHKFNRNVYTNVQEFLVGLKSANQSRAWLYEHLVHDPLVNDRIGNQKVVVYHARESGTAFVFDRSAKGQTLTFEYKNSQITDQETSSVWNMEMGAAISGPLEDIRLTQLPSITSNRSAWERFYPNSTYWSPQDSR